MPEERAAGVTKTREEIRDARFRRSMQMTVRERLEFMERMNEAVQKLIDQQKMKPEEARAYVDDWYVEEVENGDGLSGHDSVEDPGGPQKG